MQTNELGQFVRINLAGQAFGTVVIRDNFIKAPNGGTKWQYDCKCGGVGWAWAEVLKRQPNFTCPECRKKVISIQRTTHGLRYTELYGIRSGIIDRCTNPNSDNWPDYGGRGITICERWLNSPVDFVKDVLRLYGPRPSKQHTLGRIHNNGNYEPDNCRWETTEQQGNNKRNSKFITYNGETKTYAQWARCFGMWRSSVRVQFRKGKTPEEIFGGRQRIC